MTVIDDQGRPEPPISGEELDTLRGFLDYQRATLEWKTRGLDHDGMTTRIAASSMTLGGILKHMAWVEDHWFSRSLHGTERCAPWDAVDWDADYNWEWTSSERDTPDELRALWRAACERSRQLVEQALGAGDLGQVAKRGWSDGTAPSLRWIMVHMIEEYARHNGHADLLREAVDGETGE